MTIVLIDTRHVGAALRHARRSACLGRRELAPILRIQRCELAQYESGRLVIPEDVLYRIMSYGIMMLKARNFNNRK
ncbi:MAG: helix-turn-helix domain-containing protein [Muribaculaceae bacterium]|nr:helix-turn-helix domain-containing protein [Muribaculaceae bacterium]